MTKKSWGATAAQWEHLISLGLRDDLLPVVSNVDADISPMSKMKALGKTPSVYNNRRHAVGVKNWTTRVTSDADIELWKDEPDYGICQQTRGAVKCFDVDHPDKAITDAIVADICELLGVTLPKRWRENSGKCLLMFAMTGEYRKRILRIDGGIIEFLATGQQFVAFGTHPSGVAYQWTPELPELIVITPEQFEMVWSYLESEYGVAPTVEAGGARKRGPSLTVADRTLDFLWDKGMVIDGNKEKVFIICPFAHEHTTETSDSATTYMPAGTNGYEVGHFKCLHAHCTGRSDGEYIAALDVYMDEVDEVPEETPEEKAELKKAKPVRLKPKDILGIARKFLDARYATPEGSTLLRTTGLWYLHTTACYIEQPAEQIRNAIWGYLGKAVKVIKDKELGLLEVPFDPATSSVNNVLDALGSVASADNAVAPVWLDGSQPGDPRDYVSLTNGILHIPTRTLLPHSLNFFTLNTLPFAWEDEGEPTEWLKFLHTIWGDDEESKQVLQEIFGYLITPDSSHQKIFLIKGPMRSGKGTIGRMLKWLLGESNICGPSLSSLAGQFGLQPLIGKLVAVVPDARVGGNTNKQAIVERLLMVSGEDNVTIDRKHIDSWTGILPARFVMFSNEVPQLGDSSGALASRFITLAMTKTFYGSEDHQLGARLKKELPQVLRWALDGRGRLQERGYFIQPKASAALVESLERLNSPIKAFVSEVCDLGEFEQVAKDDLYEEWRTWCNLSGRDHPGTKERFCESLADAFAGVKAARLRRGDKRLQAFVGIGLKSELA